MKKRLWEKGLGKEGQEGERERKEGESEKGWKREEVKNLGRRERGK